MHRSEGIPPDRRPLWSVLRGNGSVGGLHLVELEAAIDRLLDVGGALDCVAVGIETQRARDEINGQTGQRVADGGAVGAACCLDGFQSHHVDWAFSMAATAAIYAS